MGEIVNLRQIRKRAERAEAAGAADDNRRAHGLTKAEKTIRRTEAARAGRRLDGHRLARPGEDDPAGS